MKFSDKPRLLSCTDFDLSFISKFISPDSISGKISEASVSVVEMSNSFQWLLKRAPKVIPSAFSVDFISPKSKILKRPPTSPLKRHRTGPTRLLERISWIDRCRYDPEVVFPKYFANSRTRLSLMGTTEISAKSCDGCFGKMIRGFKV